MAYYLKLEISGLPPKLNRKTAKNSKLWIAKVVKAVGNRVPEKPLAKARLVLTRCSSQNCDADNLVGSFKLIIDTLVRLKILLDDSYGIIGMPKYNLEYSIKGDGKIKVEVIG